MNTSQDEYGRLEERLTSIQRDVISLMGKMDSSLLQQNDLNTRVKILELQVNNQDNNWNRIFEAGWKIAIFMICGYAAFKLGIK